VATPDSSNNPRRTFETAIALMQPSRAPSKTPIGWRNRASLGSSPADEKRAVTDAARALAQLWNIAPGTAR
jgi:hypothetical protein